MPFLLETGVLTAVLRGRLGAQTRIRPWIEHGEAVTSVIVYGEIVEYLQTRTDYAQREAELRALLRIVKPYGVTYPILRRYASLRRSMRKPYGPGLIGDIDTLIAATAIEHGLTVVTLDGDFLRVPDLFVMRLDRSELM